MSVPENARSELQVALILYAISFVLPATFTRSGINSWGWQVALLSFVPLVMLVKEPGMLLMAVLVTPSNIGFITAAILLMTGAVRGALFAAAIAFGSMLYCGFAAPAQPTTDIFHSPGGHLGPGYYLWTLAGALMLLAAWHGYRDK